MRQNCEGNFTNNYNASDKSCFFQRRFESNFPQKGKARHCLHRRGRQCSSIGDKRCYAYEIVVRHPKAGKPPLAIASYFTTSHNIPSISYFISSFWHAESLLYRNNKTLPKLVMYDGNMALIQSVIQSFF